MWSRCLWTLFPLYLFLLKYRFFFFYMLDRDRGENTLIIFSLSNNPSKAYSNVSYILLILWCNSYTLQEIPQRLSFWVSPLVVVLWRKWHQRCSVGTCWQIDSTQTNVTLTSIWKIRWNNSNPSALIYANTGFGLSGLFSPHLCVFSNEFTLTMCLLIP